MSLVNFLDSIENGSNCYNHIADKSFLQALNKLKDSGKLKVPAKNVSIVAAIRALKRNKKYLINLMFDTNRTYSDNYTTQESYAKKLGIGLRSVQRYIAELVRDRIIISVTYVKRQGDKWGTCRYEFHPDIYKNAHVLKDEILSLKKYLHEVWYFFKQNREAREKPSGKQTGGQCLNAAQEELIQEEHLQIVSCRELKSSGNINFLREVYTQKGKKEVFDDFGTGIIGDSMLGIVKTSELSIVPVQKGWTTHWMLVCSAAKSMAKVVARGSQIAYAVKEEVKRVNAATVETVEDFEDIALMDLADIGLGTFEDTLWTMT